MKAAVSQELTTLTTRWVAEGVEPAEFATSTRIRLSGMTGLPPDASSAVAAFVGLLLGASALVLLIASVNVAAMLSARAVARRREMAVRAALGAARGRLVRQLLTESMLLFGMGALGGMGLAVLATSALERLPLPADVPLVLELSPDYRVLGFALLLSLVTALLFGLAPALRASRPDITARLRDDSAGGGTRRSLASRVLVGGQLAMSLLLLVAAGLFLRALDRGRNVELGFDGSRVATATLTPEAWGYDETEARRFQGELRRELEGAPGVIAVSFTGVLPLSMGSSSDRITPPGADPAADDDGLLVQASTVDADYFDVLSLPVLRGRPLLATDDARAPRVAVVNETLANRLWPAGDAVGHTFRHAGDVVTVVGVARDAKYADLSSRTPPFVYFPTAQQWPRLQHLLVRTAGDPASIAPEVRRAIRALDAAVPIPQVRSFEQAASLVLLPQRVAAMVTGALGALGLLLATVGLYGTTAYAISGRTRELGIRVALGARRGDVLRMVVREGMGVALGGVVVGVLLAAAASRLMASLLFDLSPLDAPTFLATSALLVLVALLASYLPARRAAGADPMVALRGE